MNISVIIKSRLPDLTAITAIQTLTNIMGYKEVLNRLESSVLFEIATDETEEKAVALIGDAIEKTTLFCNPNKETAVILNRNRDLSKVFSVSRGTGLVARVSDLEGVEDLAPILWRQWGYREIKSVIKYPIWFIELNLNDREKAIQLAEEILITESRENGLLINPHYQRAEIISVFSA
ncbi:MAG: hypothetical protein DRH51_03845 [Candidatus Coatesbacteria bacterium]|nr:MAG: hypothetical protein DRH51_03845 [Candidatus Coatesbacteria bacterium]